MSSQPSYSKTDDLSPEQTAALQEVLEAKIDGEVRFDTCSRALYSTDASVYQITPLGVVIPRSQLDVVTTVNICREYNCSITARGGGTSQCGQAVGAGIQIDFSKYMNRILELDAEKRTVRVEPGIVLDELNAQVKPLGLHLPLDISTSNQATIGGMIANNSAGTRSIVYGKTIDYVLELTVVLSDGNVVNMQPVNEDELLAKCSQTDREGACYQIVQKLAAEHEDEINCRFPRILRRVGGYNLDEFTPSNGHFNLARMMVGSEGTLGLTVEAVLRLVPLPQFRVVCAVQFDELLEAMAAIQVIIRHKPSAVELIDRFILNTTRGKTEFEPLRSFIVGDPGAVLIVEFSGEHQDELPQRIDRLETTLREHGMGNYVHRAIDPAEQARIWKLRKAALGLSMSETGDAKAISFVEDTAVAPEHLHDYIKRFRKILSANDTQAGFYAHASVGLLHIRPVVNMKTADGIEKFKRIADKISDLVLEYGGTLSGEHGDGLARSPFQEKMFGPVLYRAFCEVKHTFDPEGLLNPGKIVHPPPLTDNLRFGVNYRTAQLDTAFDFSDFGGISRAAEQCSGIGECRKTHTGTMCPSYMATRDEADSTRGRANVLRLAISGQLGPEGFSDKDLYPVLDLCLECKSCKRECPTGVDMARLKSEFLHQYYTRHGIPLRARFFAHTEKTALWGSRLAPVSNMITGNSILRWFNEKILDLDRRRDYPAFARHTFMDWWKLHSQSNGSPHDSTSLQVVVFSDTFTNFYEPEHAIAAVRFAERLGLQVIVPPRICCGRPLISKGFLDRAKVQAAAITQVLAPFAHRGLPILFCEPGCYSAVRDDHPFLLRGSMKSDAEVVASACVTFEEWANTVIGSSNRNTKNKNKTIFQAGPGQIMFHAHCHQKALVGSGPTARIMSMIPDCTVTVPDAGCCGMGGSFGYEREHYEVSRTIGEQRLFPAIREMSPDGSVVASGFSCRQQIKHFTGVDALSPMVLLESLLISG